MFVCLSVCPSHGWISQKRCKLGSPNLHCRVWRQNGLSLATKLRIYTTCVLAVSLHGAETRTLSKEDSRRLQAFHMTCQRRILGVRWNDFVTNRAVADSTNLPSILSIIAARRHSFFNHIRHLPANTPAHKALKLFSRFQVRRHTTPRLESPRW